MRKNLVSKFVILAILASPITLSYGNVDHVKAELECLAMNIYYEARGEPHLGKIAVGMVTVNRVKSGSYPQTICGVVTQKWRKTCQFSWVCTNKLPQIRHDVYTEIQDIARKIYFGETKDITNGATHFHSVKVNPAWAESKRVTFRVGEHIFYRK